MCITNCDGVSIPQPIERLIRLHHINNAFAITRVQEPRHAPSISQPQLRIIILDCSYRPGHLHLMHEDVDVLRCPRLISIGIQSVGTHEQAFDSHRVQNLNDFLRSYLRSFRLVHSTKVRRQEATSV